MRFKLIILFVLIVLFILFGFISQTNIPPVLAQEYSEIQTVFFSNSPVSLIDLAEGIPGEGWLIYYLSEGGEKYPKLAVNLRKDEFDANARAYIYQTPEYRGVLPISISNDEVTLQDDLQPAIVIESLDGWWKRDGVINYNLDITINHAIHATWGGDQIISLIHEIPHPFVKIIVRDTNLDGIPDWDLRLVLPEFSGYSFLQTSYTERKCKTPIEFDYGVSPEWPFVAYDGLFEQESGKIRSPIVVDWSRGNIAYFSEIVTARQQNCSYTLYSMPRIDFDEVNVTNFESPFAFYDLSGEGTGYPNMILRTQRHPANDRRTYLYNEQFELIRYSWKNDIGDWTWDYKVEVLGFHPYDYQNKIAGGAVIIDAPPYEEFPHWVVSKKWPVAIFVDTEGGYFRSSEGIYEWSPFDLDFEYFLGWKDYPSKDAFQEIEPGFRGEYRIKNDLEPKLYLSPIDNRLHLVGAEYGLWNLGNGFVLREHNLDGDNLIDGWTREFQRDDPLITNDYQLSDKNHTIEEALYSLSGFQIYSGFGQTEILETDYDPIILEVLPPINQETWKYFKDVIEPITASRKNPWEIYKWLEDFPGDGLQIEESIVDNMHATKSGFSFSLTLNTNYAIQGDDFIGLNTLKPGKYRIEYDRELGWFAVQNLSEPVYSLSFKTSNDVIAKTGERLLVELEAHNNSSDVSKYLEFVSVVNVDGENVEIKRLPVGYGISEIKFNWQPLDTGTVKILAWLEDESGNVGAEDDLLINVIKGPEDGFIQIFTQSTDNGRRSVAVVVLFVFIFVIGISVRQLTQNK